MASRIPPATVLRHHLLLRVSKLHHLSGFATPLFTPLASFCCGDLFTAHNNAPIHRRSFPLSASNSSTWSGRCRATNPGSSPPPKLDPPPVDNPDSSSSGIISRLSRVQDAVRIFFAVLFWMSLFFWSCVWDGGNDGRPNKSSRFRR